MRSLTVLIIGFILNHLKYRLTLPDMLKCITLSHQRRIFLPGAEIAFFTEHLGVITVVFQHGQIFPSVLQMLVDMEMSMVPAVESRKLFELREKRRLMSPSLVAQSSDQKPSLVPTKNIEQKARNRYFMSICNAWINSNDSICASTRNDYMGKIK